MDQKKLFICSQQNCFYATFFDFAYGRHLVKHKNIQSENNFSCLEDLKNSERLYSVTGDSGWEYYCLQCGYSSFSLLVFHRHKVIKACLQNEIYKIQFRNTPNNFECYYCPFITQLEDEVIKHVQSSHKFLKKTRQGHPLTEYRAFQNPKNYNCRKCPFRTINKRLYDSHVFRIHNVFNGLKYFYCDLCSYKGASQKIIERHKIYRHTRPEDVIWYSCPKNNCDYRSREIYELNRHNRLKHSDIVFNCDQCNFVTKFEKTFKIHTRDVHIDKINDSSPPKLRYRYYYCPECRFKSVKMDLLTSHIEINHKTRVNHYKIETPEVTSSRRELPPRAAKLSIEKPKQENYITKVKIEPQVKSEDLHRSFFVCSICLRAFYKKVGLRTHLRLHHSLYACSKCKFKGDSTESLEKHECLKCTQCDFMAKSDSNLAFHIMNVHFL